MPTLIDATGTEHNIVQPPSRIISLVPSTTHSVCILGKRKQLVGITNFCNRPNSIRSRIEKVGGTKNVSIEKVIRLQPDIVLANKEENTKEDIETLRKHNIPVFVAFPQTLEQALIDLIDLGRILDATHRAQKLVEEIQNSSF